MTAAAMPGTPYRLATGETIPDMHPDDVVAVASVIEDFAERGACFADAVAHGLATWRACRERRALLERVAARQEGVVVSSSFR